MAFGNSLLLGCSGTAAGWDLSLRILRTCDVSELRKVRTVEKMRKTGWDEKWWEGSGKRWERLGRDEKKWEKVRQVEKSWEEWRRSEKNWEKVGRVEKMSQELRRAEKGSQQLRRIWRVEKGSEEVRTNSQKSSKSLMLQLNSYTEMCSSLP